MADEKKPEGKPADKPAAAPTNDPFVEMVWVIIALFFAMYIINILAGFIQSGEIMLIIRKYVPDFLLSLRKIFLFYKITVIILSVGLIGFIIYLYNRLVILRANEAKLYYPEDIKIVTGTGDLRNAEWDKVLKNIESTNDSDWRLAILEADIMLNTLLDNMGLPGDTIGDKLKAVEKSDFTTVDKAWEAHKIRNQIAHEGSTFLLSLHEAKRVIALYQAVFEEFRII